MAFSPSTAATRPDARLLAPSRETRFRGDWFVAGDVVSFDDDDTSDSTAVRRRDQCRRLPGLAARVEEALDDHPPSRRRPSPVRVRDGVRIITAWIVLRPGVVADATGTCVIAEARPRSPTTSGPARCFVDALPRRTAGRRRMPDLGAAPVLGRRAGP
jgi:hypothetical protein